MHAFVAVVAINWHHALLARSYVARAVIPWRNRDVASAAALLISGPVIMKTAEPDNRVVAVATRVGFIEAGSDLIHVEVRDVALVPSHLAFVLPSELDDVAISPSLDSELEQLICWYEQGVPGY